jgi:dipeptidyl aminopeptidase/acylaminoacyl peptidase
MVRFRKLAPVVACLCASSGAAMAATHPFSVQDMQAMLRVSDPRLSPDGKRVAFVVAETDLDANKRRSDVYLADTGGTNVRRVTQDPANDTSPRWAADGQSLYFLSTRSGRQEVWRLHLAGGEAEKVTDEPLDIDALEVGPGGKTLLFTMPVFPNTTPAETRQKLDAKEKAKSSGTIYDQVFVRHWDSWADGTRNHLFAYPLPGGPARDLMPAMDADCPSKPFGGSEEYGVSPDGSTLLFSARDVGREEPWSTNFDLFEVPLAGGVAPKRLTTNPAWDTQPHYSPDGKRIAYLAMDRAGFEADRFHFVLRDAASGQERRLDVGINTSKRGDRSPSEFVWSADGKELYWGADHLGQHALFATAVATGKSRLVVAQGTTSAPQALAGGRVLYAMNSLLGPTELYVTAARNGKPAAVTQLNAERVAAARFGKPEAFRFIGAHGDSVYGYLVRPVDFEPGRKYPVAFLIHGGPQGSFGNDFHYRWNPQAYAGAGYAAVMVDFHGSTGYGQAFTDAIRGDWGGAPYDDLMLGLDYALGHWNFLDGDRVGALGASYGGYMINWIAGKTDRFRCLVSHDGTLNERMAYFDTEELWFPEWEHNGTPWENPDAYTKHSPDQLVQNWKTPMLVVHSSKDFRVVETQGLGVFNALQRRGIPSKLLVFPDENHWVLKPQNSILWHETVLGWLDQWLKGGGGGQAASRKAP